jgi:cytochrome c553
MNQVMEDFTDQEIKEIAAYISKLSLCEAQAQVDEHPDADVKKGEKIFKRSCFECHKKDTSGIGPVIHGQKTRYLENAIKSFQTTWYEPRPSRVNMRSYTDMLNEQDIKNVAAYLNEQKLCE